MSSSEAALRSPPKRTAGRYVRIGIAIFASIVFLFPIFWMVLTSFKLPRDIFTTPPTLFFKPTLETYINYMSHADIPRRMLNTVIVACGAGLISIVAGAMAGYALARVRLKGAATIGVLILLSRGVPPIALAVPMFLVARRLDIVDQHITLILAYCTFLIPYVMWLMRGFFISLPTELEHAARIDGCSDWQIFRHVMLPLAAPGIATVAILNFVSIWNDYQLSLVLINSPENRTLSLGLYSLITSMQYSGGNWPGLFAGVTMVMLPTILIYLFLSQRMISGITMGGVK